MIICPFDLARVMNNNRIEGSKLVQFKEIRHALNIEEEEKTNEELIKIITYTQAPFFLII
jgi:hypothetical protein